MPYEKEATHLLLDLAAMESTPSKWTRSAPAFPVALGLVSGIAWDAKQPLASEVYLILFAMCGTWILSQWFSHRFQFAAMPLSSDSARGSLRPRGTRVAWIILVIGSACCGAVLHAAHFRHLPANHIARYLGSEPSYVTLEGVIISQPRLVRASNVDFSKGRERPPSTSFLLYVEKIGTGSKAHEVSGVVQTTVYEPTVDCVRGDGIRIHGKLMKLREPTNPDQYDWALSSRRMGVHARLMCSHQEAIVPLATRDNFNWRHCVSLIQMKVRSLLLDHVFDPDQDEQSVLRGMILGEQSQIAPRLRSAFRNTGTGHFLALSGLHVGMLALFVWLVCFGMGLTRRGASVWTICVLLMYALLVEPRPSVFRATMMVCIFCFGYVLRRPVNTLNSISIAAVVLLVCGPMQLFQPGFQLSFVVTLGIIYLLPLFQVPFSRAPGGTAASFPMTTAATSKAGAVTSYLVRLFLHTTRRYMVSSMWVCLVAWVVGSPLAAYHFNNIYLWGWFASVALMPFVLVTMLAGFTKLLAGLLYSPSGLILGPLLEAATVALVWMVELLEKLPACSLDVPKPTGAWLVFFYGVLTLIACQRSFILQRRSMARKLALMLSLSVLLPVVPTFFARWPDWQLKLHILDVGAGSATVIELPNGRICLYDAGTSGDFDVGNNVVMPLIRKLGAYRIDAAIISHANYDHYSALPSLARGTHIRQVVTTGYFEHPESGEQTVRELLAHLRSHRISLSQIDSSISDLSRIVPALDPVKAEILWPPGDLPETVLSNDTSLVLKLSYANHSVLLTGDIEEYAERRLMESGIDLTANILILPHHGSITPATERFIDAVQPRYVIRSSDQPRKDAPSHIEQMSYTAQYFNTADGGAITAILGPEGIRIQYDR